MIHLKCFENHKKILYPYNEIKYFVDWFEEKYGEIVAKQGWAIFDSDTDYPSKKYISNSNPFIKFWQIEKLDDMNILSTDQDADELAKKMGLMIDNKYGIIIGYNGVSFLDNQEELDIYKNINKYNL